MYSRQKKMNHKGTNKPIGKGNSSKEKQNLTKNKKCRFVGI